MKKQNLTTVSAIIGVLILVGGVLYFNHQNLAYANAEEFNSSIQEKSSINLNRYKQYKAYGLNYDAKKERFYYNKKLVRCFKDQVNFDGTVIGFSHSDGEVDVVAKRDSNYKLKGLESQSQQEFDTRTTKLYNSLSDLNGSKSIEEGEPANDDSLSAYEAYGVKYDKEHDAWSYNGRIIRAFHDKGHQSYLSNEEIARKSKLDLIVNRDKTGNIEDIAEMAPEQFKTIFE